jgi:hypothetical protein
MTDTLSKITDWFEALTPQTLASIDAVYASDAHFKDPFNDVVGIGDIRKIYAHMFENLTNPRFVITCTIEQVEPVHEAFVAWQFRFDWRGRAFDIPGGTRFVLNDQGLVADHVDYWDVAELYERLPVLGSLLRPLRKRMAAV